MLCLADPFSFQLGSVARSRSRCFGSSFPLSCHSHCFHQIIRQPQRFHLEPIRTYSNQASVSVLATSRCFQHRLLRIVMLEAHPEFPYGWALHTAHPSLPTSPSPSLLFSTSPELPSWSYFLILLLHPPHPIYHQHLLPLSQQSLRSDLLPLPPPPSPSPFILPLLE